MTMSKYATQADYWKAKAESLQAKVDALMLEYCPEEMTPEQKANWAAHQVAATPEQEAAIDAALQ
jgi:hypothetical protein